MLIGETDDTPDLPVGLGGVLLESADWKGELRDRILSPDDQQHRTIIPAVDKSIELTVVEMFPILGLTQ